MKTLWILFLLTPMLSIFADGKMYRPRVEDVPVGIPYQRAIILHHDQTQTMFLQSQYQLPKGGKPEELAWVIPLPSVPEIASDPDFEKPINNIFKQLDFESAPQIKDISDIILRWCLPVVVLGLGIFMISKTSSNKGRSKKQVVLDIIILSIFVLFVLAITLPSFSKARGSGSAVEVVIDKQIGIYAVKVIQSEDAQAIADWLSSNGFAYDQSDESYFAKHVASGGCFITARINLVDSVQQENFQNEGLADPLIFQFHSPEPMYPLALTGSAGEDTTVLLYLMSQQAYTQNVGLDMKFLGESRFAKSLIDSVLEYFSSEEGGMKLTLPPEESYNRLMKFKATLTPEQMRQDLIFTPAPNLPDFRGHRFGW